MHVQLAVRFNKGQHLISCNQQTNQYYYTLVLVIDTILPQQTMQQSHQLLIPTPANAKYWCNR